MRQAAGQRMSVLAPPDLGALILLHGCRTGYCGMRCKGCRSCMAMG